MEHRDSYITKHTECDAIHKSYEQEIIGYEPFEFPRNLATLSYGIEWEDNVNY
jgi:hypothetical protein